MSTKIFVNLPVKDLPTSIKFYEALGYSFNPQFTNESGACMVVNEHIYAMLLTHPMFKSFIHKEICDTKTSTEVLICLSCENRDEVNEFVSKAVAAGGKAHMEPRDHGFMYEYGYEDPDGHIWSLFYMDPAVIQ